MVRESGVGIDGWKVDEAGEAGPHPQVAAIAKVSDRPPTRVGRAAVPGPAARQPG